MTGTFTELGIPADLVSILRRDRVRKPSPFQAAALPDAVKGKDIWGMAPTSSGTTLAFGLALVLRTQRARSSRPTSLVLVATRKLANQIGRELHTLAATRSLRIATVGDGNDCDKQRMALRHGVEILIACPEPLEDLIEQRDLHLSDVAMVVVNEADRLTAMGCEAAIGRILEATAPDRQVLLYSSAPDDGVSVLTRGYQRAPRVFHAEMPAGSEAVEEEVEMSELRLVASAVDNRPSGGAQGPVVRSSNRRARRRPGARRN